MAIKESLSKFQKPYQLLRAVKDMAFWKLTVTSFHNSLAEKFPSDLLTFLGISNDLEIDELAKMTDYFIPKI